MRYISSGCKVGISTLFFSLLFFFSLSGQALAASHTVVPGDSLWAIGNSCGVTVAQLKAANRLDGDIIFPGQQLVIPARAPQVSRGGGDREFTASDFDTLARIITAEADNQDYDTQVAVGAVVLNRTKNPQFPDTIRGVVYHVDENGRYQFEPVLNGWINRPPSESAQKAARDVLSGADPTGGALFFWESWVKNSYLNSRPLAKVMGEFTFTY